MTGSTFARSLEAVRQAPFLLDGYRATEQLVLAAAGAPAGESLRALGAVVADPADQLGRIAAVHALGAVRDDRADVMLSDLLSSKDAFVREHAAWALGARLPRLDAVGRLVATVVAGDFPGVLAQRTLARWARHTPDHIALALEGTLAADHLPEVAARLVETLGLVPGRIAARLLRQAAASVDQPAQVRRAAVAAIGDRRDDPFAADLVHQLAGADDDLAATAQLAAYDLTLPTPLPRPRGAGLTVAQLFLHADLDPTVSMAGAGDNGGIATLLVRLAGSLVSTSGISRVLTLSRGSEQQAAEQLGRAGRNQLIPVPLLTETLNSTRAWPAWVAAERGIRRGLRAHGPVDVMHLRMGDVGSMAAAAAAHSLQIPTVFTLAPDPHTVIRALDMSGSMSRSNFGDLDAREHLWFRLHLVQRLAEGASRIALFPREDLGNELQDLLGVDIATDPVRYRVVPEGIDLTVTHQALAEVEPSWARPVLASASLTDLAARIRKLPEHRQGLPIALSVGRLHRVKGMATVVEAWAGNPDLRARCNLVIVGGDLVNPSPDELGQLQAIQQIVQSHPAAADGLVLTGHRSNDTVARWLAAARLGLDDVIGPDGIYVCGSLKEEFGLAILEALATGLVVVTPDSGGPATYLEHDRTGVLVDTSNPILLGNAMVRALDLATAPDRTAHRQAAQQRVADNFTVQAMATTLGTIYREVAAGGPVRRREVFGLSTMQHPSGSAARS